MRVISNNILDAVGQTPVIKLQKISDQERAVYIKMEGSNPAGSMKDRTSKMIISELLREGKISTGGTVIESSSGNMAVGLAQACLFYGLNLVVVVDLNLNPHTKKILEAYGAELVVVSEPHSNGGFLSARLEKVNQLLNSIPDSVWSNQYSNPNNPRAYRETMEEIMQTLNSKVDYMFVATSTCGCLMGCADYINFHKLSTRLIAVDAEGSVLFGQLPAKRRIPGHGAGVSSKFLDRSKVFDVVHVSDAECVEGCRSLLRKEAILSGGSSGGIVSAYEKYRDNLPTDANSVFLFADRGERYLDTIYCDEWVEKNIGLRYSTSNSLSRIMDENNISIHENASL